MEKNDRGSSRGHAHGGSPVSGRQHKLSTGPRRFSQLGRCRAHNGDRERERESDDVNAQPKKDKLPSPSPAQHMSASSEPDATAATKYQSHWCFSGCVASRLNKAAAAAHKNRIARPHEANPLLFRGGKKAATAESQPIMITRRNRRGQHDVSREPGAGWQQPKKLQQRLRRGDLSRPAPETLALRGRPNPRAT